MLNIEELNKIATKSQAQLVNVYREYCQNLFLSFLYQENDSNNIQFKGGTALRIYYKSPRYSEDLDFSVFKLNKKQVEDKMLSVLFNLEKANLKPELEESKETGGGYLANLTLLIGENKVKISLQASRRKMAYAQPNLVLINNDFIPPYTIYLLNEKDLIKEKLEAAVTRSKPRDFFDIYFLLRKGSIGIEQISLLKQTVNIVEKSKINFRRELADFLPKNLHAVSADFPHIYLQEVKKYL